MCECVSTIQVSISGAVIIQRSYDPLRQLSSHTYFREKCETVHIYLTLKFLEVITAGGRISVGLSKRWAHLYYRTIA